MEYVQGEVIMLSCSSFLAVYFPNKFYKTKYLKHKQIFKFVLKEKGKKEIWKVQKSKKKKKVVCLCYIL